MYPFFKKITDDPGRFLLGVILVSILIWTLQCSLLQNILGIDSIETVVWGAQHAWGYGKHPPLSGWIGGSFSFLGGRADWPLYFACQLMLGIGVWFVYRTALLFTDRITAATGATMLYFLFHYTPSLMKFSTYFVETALIPLAAWSFFSALKRNKFGCWLLWGVFCGLGMLNKYSFAMIIFGFAVIFFLEKDYRIRWKSAGPWLGAAIALALFTPHFIWLKNHDFCCLFHIGNRLNTSWLWSEPIVTLASGLYPVVSAFGVLFLCALPGWKNAEKQKFNAPLFRWSLILSAVPVAVWFGMALCRQAVVQQWFCSMASWTALLAISLFPLKITQTLFRRIAGLLIIVITVIFIVSGCDLLFKTRDRLHSRPEDIIASVMEFWHRHSSEPVPVVYGDLWYCGIMHNYTPERPPACDVFDRPCFQRYKALMDEKGALIIGSEDEDKLFCRETGYWVKYVKIFYPCRSVFGKIKQEYVYVGYYPPRAEREKRKDNPEEK